MADTPPPELQPASQNKWYMLATAGEDHTDNTRRWNGYMYDLVGKGATLDLKRADGTPIVLPTLSPDEMEWIAINIPGLPQELPEEISLSGLNFAAAVNFQDFYFPVSVDFSRSRFGGNARFTGSTFAEEAHFKESRFARTARFTRSTFAEEADFTGSRFAGTASFTGSTFAEEADFTGSRFAGTASFTRSTFAKYADFTGSRPLPRRCFL